MTDLSGKYVANTRGRPFQQGNPGKPKGARHKATQLAQKLMQDDAAAIVNVVIEAAKGGDLAAARIVLDRIAPARKDFPVSFALPTIETAEDAACGMSAILSAVSQGQLTPTEAFEIAKLLDIFVHTLEASELEARMRKLEAQGPQ